MDVYGTLKQNIYVKDYFHVFLVAVFRIWIRIVDNFLIVIS